MGSEESSTGQVKEATVLAPEPIERLREMGRALGMEVPRRIIRLFLDDAPVRLADLSKSLREEDAGATEQVAHSLRGSSANLGATAFAQLCHEMEQLAGGSALAEARERFDDLEAELGRVDQAMRELLVELS